MIKRILSAMAVFLVLIFAYAFFGGVSKMDISLKHDMQRYVVDEPFEAGDIVEVSPDGQRILGLLCDVDLPTGRWANAAVRARYYNVIDESQPMVMKFISNAVRIFAPDLPQVQETETQPGEGLEFVGEKRRIVGDAAGDISNRCHCDVARAVLERKAAACVVDKALVESETVEGPNGPVVNLTTVALSFKKNPIFYEDPSALKPFCPDLNTLARAPRGQSCDGVFGYSPDVRARGRFGLIREATLDQTRSDPPIIAASEEAQ